METRTDQRMNGHRPSSPYVPGDIIYHHGATLARIEVRLEYMDHRIRKLETNSMLGLMPLHWVQIGIGITVLGAAVTGRISWGESLPIVGRMFGGL